MFDNTIRQILYLITLSFMFCFSGHFYVHRRCAIWSDKVKIKIVKSESESNEKKSKEIETYVGVDQVCYPQLKEHATLQFEIVKRSFLIS